MAKLGLGVTRPNIAKLYNNFVVENCLVPIAKELGVELRIETR